MCMNQVIDLVLNLPGTKRKLLYYKKTNFDWFLESESMDKQFVYQNY
jgi:hypothetical protein